GRSLTDRLLIRTLSYGRWLFSDPAPPCPLLFTLAVDKPGGVLLCPAAPRPDGWSARCCAITPSQKSWTLALSAAACSRWKAMASFFLPLSPPWPDSHAVHSPNHA